MLATICEKMALSDPWFQYRYNPKDRLYFADGTTVRYRADGTVEQIEEYRDLLTEVVYRRCRHVISENNRVLRMVEALKRGDVREIPQLMRESHESLRDDFEVSCRELDLMVEIASAKRGVLGSRMTGGGFGGCTINLVESSAAKEFQERVGAEYEIKTGLRPDILICEASQGVEAVDPKGSEDRSALLQ